MLIFFIFFAILVALFGSFFWSLFDFLEFRGHFFYNFVPTVTG